MKVKRTKRTIKKEGKGKGKMTNKNIDWEAIFPGSDNLTDYIASELADVLVYVGGDFTLENKHFVDDMAEELTQLFYEHAFKNGIDGATDDEFEATVKAFKTIIETVYDDAYLQAVEWCQDNYDDYLEREREYRSLVLGN